jgi:hypothetical protein
MNGHKDQRKDSFFTEKKTKIKWRFSLKCDILNSMIISYWIW